MEKQLIDHCAVFPTSMACPHCGEKINCTPLWQGIHICVKGTCEHCHKTLVSDLPVGQAIYTPYMASLECKQLFGNEQCRAWFGQPLLDSLLMPDDQSVGFSVEKVRHCERVIILNCLDFLYGHGLLKLLNADWHLQKHDDCGLVVIVPKSLRWMVPDGVAEIWVADLSLSAMRRFYPELDQKIQHECKRFSEIKLSPAYSHPSCFDITRFTRVSQHDFLKQNSRITFIWRDDRLWVSATLVYRIFRKLGMTSAFRWWQKKKVMRLFKRLKATLPDMRYTVAGVGRDGRFPSWVDDQRIAPPLTDAQEKKLCEIYSESRMVIGIHGSNMLLPSAHAGMVVDLMPVDRWGNLAQDNLMLHGNFHMVQYRSRYLPINTRISDVAHIVSNNVTNIHDVMTYFDFPEGT